MKVHLSQHRTIDHIFHLYSKEVRRIATHVLINNGFLGIDARPDAPDSLEKLVAVFMQEPRPKYFPVFDGGCDQTIFDSPMENQLFRAWHDIGHVLLNQPFTAYGEYEVAMWQANQLTGINMAILIADVIAQDRYYREHNEFVKDQRAFVAQEVFGKGDYQFKIAA